MLHLVQLGVVAGYHDRARPTPTLTTPQLCATEVHWGRSRSNSANMQAPGGARAGVRNGGYDWSAGNTAASFLGRDGPREPIRI